MAIISILLMIVIIDIDWQKASTRREKGEEEKHAVSVVMSSSLIKKYNKKLDPAFIWNQRLFTKIYTCTRRLKGTLWLIETLLLVNLW